MKNYIYFYLLLVALCLSFMACIKQDDGQQQQSSPKCSFTIDEAKAFFESQQASTTRVGEKAAPLSPGDFTPLWAHAQTAQDRQLSSVHIPITSQYRYQVIRNEYKNGSVSAHNVCVTQKLIVVKGHTNNAMTQYMVTLIPDYTYYTKHKGEIDTEFLTIEAISDFSGIVIYTHPILRIIVRVNQYRKGAKIAGIYIPATTRGQTLCNIDKAKTIIGEIAISKSIPTATTRWGEDSYEPDYTDSDNDSGGNWWDGYTDLGDQRYDDGNGGSDSYPSWFDGSGYWYDTNNDGTPDQYYDLLNPDPRSDSELNSEPEPDPEPSFPDPDPYPEPDPDTDTDPGNILDENPYIEDDSSPTGESTTLQDQLKKLQKNVVSAKLMSLVLVDKIKVIPPPKGKEAYGGVCHKDGSIDLYSLTVGVASEIILLEELMHRYQKSQTNIHGEYKGNIEIEAKLLVWDYIKSYYSDNMIRANLGDSWMQFGTFAENPNVETWGDALAALYRMNYNPKDFPTSDYSKFRDDNYQNVK